MKKTSRGFISMMVVMTILMQMFVMAPTVFADDNETVVLSEEDFLNLAGTVATTSPDFITVEDGVMTISQNSDKKTNTSIDFQKLQTAACDDVLVLEYSIKFSTTAVTGYGYRLPRLSYDKGYLEMYTSGVNGVGGGIGGYFAGASTTRISVLSQSKVDEWHDITYIMDFKTGAQKLLVDDELVGSLASVEAGSRPTYVSNLNINLPADDDSHGELSYQFKNVSIKTYAGDFGLVSTNLNDGAENVDVNNLEFVFSSPVYAKDLKAALIIEDSTGTEADCTKTVTLSEDGKTAYVSLQGLTPRSTYTLTIPATFKSLYGLTIAEEVVRSFSPIKVYPTEKVIATTDYFADLANCVSAGWGATGNKTITYNDEGGYIEYFCSYENENAAEVVTYNVSDIADSGVLVAKFKMFIPQESYVYYNDIRFTMNDTSYATVSYRENGLVGYSIDSVGATFYSGDTKNKWMDVACVVDLDNGIQHYYLDGKLVLTQEFTKYSPNKLKSVAFFIKIDSANMKNGILRLKDISIVRKPYVEMEMDSNNIDPVNPIEIKLTSALPETELEKIKDAMTIKENGEKIPNDIQVSFNGDDLSSILISIDGDLKYNTDYTLCIDNTFSVEYSITMQKPYEESFKTVKPVHTVNIVDKVTLTYKNQNGEATANKAEAATVNAVVKVTNPLSQQMTPYVVVAAFGADEKVIGIKGKTVTVAGNTTSDAISYEFSGLSEEVKFVRAYIFDKANTLRLLHYPIEF